MWMLLQQRGKRNNRRKDRFVSSQEASDNTRQLKETGERESGGRYDSDHSKKKELH